MKLPEPTHRSYQLVNGEHQPFYTEAQMREMYWQGLEDAAKVVQEHPFWLGNKAKEEITASIRALKEKAND